MPVSGIIYIHPQDYVKRMALCQRQLTAQYRLPILSLKNSTKVLLPTGEVYPPPAAPKATRGLGEGAQPPLSPLPSREGKKVDGQAV